MAPHSSKTHSIGPKAPVAETALADVEAALERLEKLGAEADLNTMVIGLSPALAATQIYLFSAQSLSILYENAVSIQKQQTEFANRAARMATREAGRITGQAARAADREMSDPDQEVVELLKKLKRLI